MATSRIYLPDTNILIHMVRQSPLYGRISGQYPLAPTGSRPILSNIIVGEIRAFAKHSQWGQAKQDTLDDFISFCTIIPLEETGLVAAYVDIDERSRKVGRTMGDHDMWIAATALVTGATLLTTDKDFDHLSPGFIQRKWIDPVTP